MTILIDELYALTSVNGGLFCKRIEDKNYLILFLNKLEAIIFLLMELQANDIDLDFLPIELIRNEFLLSEVEKKHNETGLEFILVNGFRSIRKDQFVEHWISSIKDSGIADPVTYFMDLDEFKNGIHMSKLKLKGTKATAFQRNIRMTNSTDDELLYEFAQRIVAEMNANTMFINDYEGKPNVTHVFYEEQGQQQLH